MREALGRHGLLSASLLGIYSSREKVKIVGQDHGPWVAAADTQIGLRLPKCLLVLACTPRWGATFCIHLWNSLSRLWSALQGVVGQGVGPYRVHAAERLHKPSPFHEYISLEQERHEMAHFLEGCRKMRSLGERIAFFG